mmetsp:Transcript_20908/g.45382  ORF Transcript_20908/g.45382 Transcript_20908/m.45382 type:complete len:323 (+) Transcript_20908:161-1129(+)|eukprot:CAMPEP_0168731752 /NCGR_PEP_ID=MMETSP0724-20121128/7422_1 /TAXON_ID=265536 /ORGANISM="Amphiprora sp., Strain CCMP467" /LENGTH=322 /DNA_ID=CAMNT_0008778759 /DNA_START=153 /DNA_END=1121 /DNA_ORIENTATION=+
MKFSVATLLTLCATQASAFVVQTPAASTTALHSSFMQPPGGMGGGMGSGMQSGPGQQQGRSGGVQTEQRAPPRPSGAPRQQGGAMAEGRPQRRNGRELKKNEVTIQGGTLKTWSFLNPAIDSVEVFLSTEGRPLDADIELWQGPDNTPHKMRVYLEDGNSRAFQSIILTPRGPNTIAIRNIGQMEFPMNAAVNAENKFPAMGESRVIQGGALRTYPFDPMVDSVAMKLTTDGRPLNARIELLQGPNNNKQVIELYTEDGMDRPFFAILKTPGSGNVVRVVNTATVEFPLSASIEAYETADPGVYSEPVMGGDQGFMGNVGQW